MSEPPASRRSRKALLKRSGIIGVVEWREGAREADPPEDSLDLHVCLTAEGRVFAFSGHVDLGTGIRTALAQMVAEELDFPIEAVEMALGDTAETPDQGPTLASETIQVTSRAMRIAATQIRREVLARAASALQCDVEALTLEDGALSRKGGSAIELSALLANERILLPLAREAEFKPVGRHKLIGTPVPRVDIPAKVDGRFVYVHDVRVPGMLHGRVVRPPYSGLDAGDFVGRSLVGVDESSIADIPGVRAVVVEGDFIGVVAEREEQAAEASLKLKAQWRAFRPPDLSDVAQAIRAHPATPRVLLDKGDVERALGDLETRLDRIYVWPYHMHGSIGPSCAVADMRADGLTVWTGSQNPHRLLKDLALLTGLPPERIEVIRHEAAGCYGRNCADDVVADAVLLSKAAGAPVRVQLTREQEHLWEPKGAAQLIEIKGGLGTGATLKAYDFHTWYPSNDAPTLALLLTGRLPNKPAALKMGDRTAVPSYAYENMRLTAYDMAPIVRASWLRGVSAMPNVFAHESYIDELADTAGVDPVAFRLRHIDDERAASLVRATAERAGWTPRTAPRGEGEILRGRGFAQARYVHGNWPGVGAAWAAWVADVAVNRATGEVTVSRVVVGQDTGMIVNPAGVTHQIHGNVLQSTSRVLREEVTFSETTAVASRDWGAYPVLTFPELPAIDVLLVDRQGEPPLGAGESASVPSAAAIANAVFDATGVRFRELPLTPERVLAGLGGAPLAKAAAQPELAKRASRWRLFGAAFAGAASFAAVSLAIAPAIAPIARPDPSTWSAATLEHGRQLAALGACVVCHTAKGGTPYAGGLALATPFGAVMSTNITPDPETGIGGWSYPAFARAMRDGLHRDGRHLYPAFPYPSFAKTSDADLQALYAFLMSQPAVRRRSEASRLTFPFNLRPLMAGWNLLFNRQRDFAPEPTRSAGWNRGRYLVDGLGHCGACHTPRNLFGAERSAAYLAGGEAEGWEAPALTGASLGPIPWSEAELYRYLKTGASQYHGAASGPMAPVVAELRELPDADIRAMAIYLASLSEPLSATQTDALVAAIERRSGRAAHPAISPIARLYEGACAACHETGRAAPLLNAGPALGLSTKVRAATATNFVNLLIEGGQHGVGSMPSFATALDDRQIADLARYTRARFAPDRPPWRDVEAAIAGARSR